MNKLMQRFFTAMEEEENPVIDQLTHDIEDAQKNHGLKTEEYDIIEKPDKLTIYDKVNKEYTDVILTPTDFKLVEAGNATCQSRQFSKDTECVVRSFRL